MKKGIIITIMAFTMAIRANAQQDTQFSQYLFNGLYINPAYAGYKEELFVQSYFRSQWVGINGAPKSFAVAADGSLNDGRVGLGAMLNSDQVGAQTSLTGYLNYAYRIQIGQDDNSHLAFGLAAGMMQLGIDGSKLTPITPGDQSIPTTSQTHIIPDANFGIYYANENYFVGASATNLLAKMIHNNNNDNLLVPVPQPHAYLTAGTLIPVNDEVKFKPVMLIKDDFKGPTTLDIDAFVLLSARLTFGGFYRSSVKLYPKNNLQGDLSPQNAFGGIVEFFATPGLRIGYSYDHSLNSLSNYSYGSHELSIGFYIGWQSDRDRSNGFRCFKF